MQQQQHQIADPVRVAALVVVALVLVAVLWITPLAATWLHSGRVPSLSLVDAVISIADADIVSDDPASTYPRDVAAQLPGAFGFWTAAALVLALLGTTVFALVREAEIRMSRPNADRRWWQLRGRRPHDFGRYRTVKELLVPGPQPGRVIVGTIARPKSLVAVTPMAQMAVLAAPRTGKSSGLVIPAILEHDGPVVATSVRNDVAQHTLARRRRLGRVFTWDPFGAESDAWDILQGCEEWEHALLVARWLGSAMRLGEAGNQSYFDEEAEGLVAPCLHAAALTESINAHGVFNWILARDQKTPDAILADAGAEDARNRLTSVYNYTERQRDGILGTAAMQLRAYGHPAAARTAQRFKGITPEDLFNGPNTLYIVAGRDHQQVLAPLVTTMVCSLMYWLSEHENRTGGAINPPALLALDETASIAPLEDLPQMLATSLGSGARFLTVWHSVAQIRHHFGADAAAEILALSQAKVFMGSVTDRFTRDEIIDLMGRSMRPMEDGRQAPDVLTAQALQRTTAGEGLLINGELPPIVFRQRRHYLDPDLKRLKGESVDGELLAAHGS